MLPAEPITTGVVLAAGLGSRLNGHAGNDHSKPLLEIQGRGLLLRTLLSLETAGCSTMVVVTGYHAEALRHSIENQYEGNARLVFAHNPDFHLQNGLSVLAAAPFAGKHFFLTMADHLLSDELMQRASRTVPPVNGAVLMVDRKLDRIFDMDDATKVLVQDNGRILKIGKTLSEFNAVDTGVFVCTDALFHALAQVKAARGDASLSDGIALLSASGRMMAEDIGDAFWQDVDTPEMLAHAEKILSGS